MAESFDKFIGDRVFLREMAEEDAPYIVAWRNDPEIQKWMISQQNITIESHLNWFRARTKRRKDYIICEKKKGLPIGTVNFVLDDYFKSAESGRLIGEKDYWGKGYAHEASLIWIEAGFQKFRLDKIIARTKINNIANIRLNTKLGFQAVGTTIIEDRFDTRIEILVMELSREMWFYG